MKEKNIFVYQLFKDISNISLFLYVKIASPLKKIIPFFPTNSPLKVKFLSRLHLEMQYWNIPTDIAQRVDGKNVVICLVIMFTPRVMVIKWSKMVHFLYFLLMPAKIKSQFGQNIYVYLKDLMQLSQKMISTLEDTEFHYFLLTQQFSQRQLQNLWTYHFLKEVKKIF